MKIKSLSVKVVGSDITTYELHETSMVYGIVSVRIVVPGVFVNVRPDIALYVTTRL